MSDYKALLEDEKAALARLGAHDEYFSRYHKNPFFRFSPATRLLGALCHMAYDAFPNHRTILRKGTYNTSSEAYRVTQKIFDEFYRVVSKNRSLPVIVVFPDRDDIETRWRGGKRKYGPLIKYFEEKGYRYIDLMDAFDIHGKDRVPGDFFGEEQYGSQHYGVLGNQMVAEHINRRLHELAARGL